MKVLLIGNYGEDKQYSMQGFSSVLLSGLPKRGVEVRLIAPRPILGRARVPYAGARKWLGYFDKYVVFPHALKRWLSWADVVHVCDQGNGIYVNHISRKPHVVTCHDLLAIRAAKGELPEQQTGWTGRVYQRMILGGLKKGKCLVSDSEATLHDLQRIVRSSAADARLLRLGLFYSYSPMCACESAAILEPLGIGATTPFLLHVGANQFYKNRRMVLRIFRALRGYPGMDQLRLVMAGKPMTDDMRQYIAENHLGEDVIELSGLSNEQLRALYSRAKALVFPSLYEGFGLPIIEAQACGCPVFTSDRAPMTEVGGKAAVYFDPTQPEQAAAVIRQHLDSTDGMIQAGLENVKRFTTEQMLDSYIQVYQEVLKG